MADVVSCFTRRKFIVMQVVFWAAVALLLFTLSGFVFLLTYPFKTIYIEEPIEVADCGKRVPSDGIVHLRFKYKKYVNVPGISLRMLVRGQDKTEVVIASSIAISNKPKGEGEGEIVFVIGNNQEAIGRDRRMVVAVFHTLFGFRTIMTQFQSEPFTIFKEGDLVK